jgi:two-component system response regulator MprA
MATVLVVDDDKDIRESLVEVLTDEGYEVTSACNGAEALEAIDRRAPDVMLLDLMMPVVNGWEVLEALRLRGTHPKLPVVILSALEAHGCADYIQKPIRLPKLLALIDTLRARVAESSSMRAAAITLPGKDPD